MHEGRAREHDAVLMLLMAVRQHAARERTAASAAARSQGGAAAFARFERARLAEHMLDDWIGFLQHTDRRPLRVLRDVTLCLFGMLSIPVNEANRTAVMHGVDLRAFARWLERAIGATDEHAVFDA
ncbi:hypothetical protein LZC95_19470 [Pendulispora brunnea]|uniref:Uncharacterized protein n=1 Tax=Pendulispora brunnea TaxID=2905690 RepID=A0ABZ2KJY6_9BACT